jgi:SPP1 family predicted phage head-tail adaptor
VIGGLNHKVTLEEELRVADGFGGITASWTEVARLWASIEATAGREALPDAERRSRLTIRWRGGVMPSMRFAFEGRVFNIEAARDPDGRARFLVCDCIEKDLP